MAITVRPIGEVAIQSPRDLVKLIRDTFADLEDQLNDRAQIYTSTDGRIPAGLNRNDILVISFRGVISLLIKNKNGFDTLTADMIGGLPARDTNYLGMQTGTAAPSLADFPEPNDWGFFRKTTAVTTFHLCFNFNNNLFKVAMA